MLVIISDLHVTDGTSGEIIDEKAFRIFRSRLSDMAYDASWRKNNGEYIPIDTINILLLGDIIDMIRSEKWNDQVEANMPWTKQRDDAFFDLLEKITNGILENNKKSFAILKDIAAGGIEIPASMQILSEEEKLKQKIGSVATGKVHPKVNIYYMVGNHDWFLYIDHPRMNSIRNKVIDELGLANERDKKFPYHPAENADLLRLQQDHNVFALHGDMFDETNCQSTGRDGSSVGDVVVLKLLNEIPNQVKNQIEKFDTKGMSDTTRDAFIKELREIDNLRPYSLAPLWISQVIKKYGLDIELVNDSIRDALKKLIHDFTKNQLVSEHHKVYLVMTVAGFLIGNSFSIENLASIIEHLSLAKDSFESYRKYARTLSMEEYGHDKKFFVMGHTHYPEIVPMSSFNLNGQQFSKIYMNTGTWRMLHKQGVYDDSLISYKTMTIAAFFKDDERMGHAFEFWTGSLDL